MSVAEMNYDKILAIITDEMGKQGIRQVDLAETIKVKQPYLNRVLNKKTVPSVEVIVSILNALGFTVKIEK